MAEIIKVEILVTVSRLVKSGVRADTTLITKEHIATIEAALDEVLELPPGAVIEVGTLEDAKAG